MTPLTVAKRDDPLDVGQAPAQTPRPSPAGGGETPPAPPAPASGTEGDTSAERTDAPAERAAARREPRRRAAGAKKTAGPYDHDRLEQTGWRLYEGLLARVRGTADELGDAGVPASAASLTAAVLHFHTPEQLDEAAELMRRWRQLTASRARAQRAGH